MGGHSQLYSEVFRKHSDGTNQAEEKSFRDAHSILQRFKTTTTVKKYFMLMLMLILVGLVL